MRFAVADKAMELFDQNGDGQVNIFAKDFFSLLSFILRNCLAFGFSFVTLIFLRFRLTRSNFSK